MLLDTDAGIQRLREAIRRSYQQLQPFRDHRVEAVREYVGQRYSDNGADDTVYVNLLELGINIYTAQLAAQSPAVSITTPHDELDRSAALQELNVNHALKAMRFVDTCQALVAEMLFGMGVVKIGMDLYGADEVNLAGELHRAGVPFADVIDLDDFVYDTTARRWNQVQFYADKYRVPVELARQVEVFDAAARKALNPSRGLTFAADSNRASGVAHEESIEGGEFQDTVELVDVFVPADRLLITMPADEGPPLWIRPWTGPEHGPYHIATLNKVPGNLMPLAPIALWMDLHKIANITFRKMARGADRYKQNYLFAKSDQQDANAAKNAKDGEILTMNDPRSFNTLTQGGIDQTLLAFFLQVKDIYSYLAGNLDALGGLSPQSETLGQDRMLLETASNRLQHYQSIFIRIVARIVRDVAWYLFYHHNQPIELTYEMPDVGRQIPVTFSPEDRKGDFLDFNYDIAPYSMRQQSPAAKLTAIRAIWKDDILPLAPIAQAQGVTPDIQEYLRLIARYGNMPELGNLVTFANPTAAHDTGPIGEPPTSYKPPTSRREYIRRNIPGASRHGRDMVVTLAALGKRSQPAAAQAVTRTMG